MTNSDKNQSGVSDWIGTRPAEPHAAGYIVAPFERPLDYVGTSGFNPSGKVLLITADHGGVAGHLRQLLTQVGAQPILVGHMDTGGLSVDDAGAEYVYDYESPEQLPGLLDTISGHLSGIDGIIHLADLDFCTDWSVLNSGDWIRLTERALLTCYHLAQLLYRRNAAESGRVRCLATVACLGGIFGCEDSAVSNPLIGLYTGFIRLVKKELPNCLVKVLDFDGADAPLQTARRVLDEIRHGDDWVEAGYRRSSRQTIPCQEDASPAVGWPVAPGKDLFNADGMPENQAGVPLLDRRLAVENYQSVVVEHDFDLDRDCYLLNYLVGGKYTLPVAMACEVMVEAASLVQPGGEVLGLADIKLHHAIKVWPGRPVKVIMRANLIEREGDISRVRVRILSGLTVPSGTGLVKERLLYEGTILLGDRRSQAASPKVDILERSNQPAIDFTRYYDFPGNYALLGPRFQTVKIVQMLSGKRILGDLRMLPEGDLFSFTAAPGLRIAPTLLDGYLQVTSTLGTLYSGQFCSPRGFRKIDVYCVPVPGEEVQVLTELVGEDEHHLYFDFTVINSRREACLVVLGYRTQCLNVLAPELLEMCKRSFGLEHLPPAERDISERVAG